MNLTGARGPRLGWLAAATLCFGVSVTPPASAQSTQKPASEPLKVRWHPEWGYVDGLDYTIAAVGLGGTLAIELSAEVPEEPRWAGRNPVDDFVRDTLRFKTRDARDSGARISDFLFYGTMTYPVFVDALAVSLIGYQDPELAWQLFVIDLEVLGVAGLIGRAGQKLSGRKRPLQVGCEEDGPDSHKFCPGTAESFISGHVAMSFAGAAATCSHHAALPLYGGIADPLTCYGLLGAATVTTSLRVNADMHWFSDVVLGAGLGLASGLVLPELLHYGRVGSGDQQALVAPMVSPDVLGAQFVGRF